MQIDLPSVFFFPRTPLLSLGSCPVQSTPTILRHGMFLPSHPQAASPFYIPFTLLTQLNKHPLTPPLDELIQHKTHIGKHKPTDIKPEELGCMAGGEFQAHVRLRAVLEARVLDLARDLVCSKKN